MRKPRKKKNAKSLVLPHSQAKLDLYNHYLEKYVAILGVTKYVRQINIFDVFCGSGIYDDGKFGSPILAFNGIAKNREFLKGFTQEEKPITLFVNDSDASKVKVVQDFIESRNSPKVCDLVFDSLPSDQMFSRIIQRINDQRVYSKNLIFIDPYGYKEIHKSTLESLLEKKSSEIILFLPVSFLYRFSEVAQIDYEEKSYEKLREFIFDFFPEDHPVRNNNVEDTFEFMDYIKEALTFDGEYFTAKHYIQRDKANYYAIFFISPSILGLEKFLTTKWENAPGHGKGFSNKKNEKQLTFFDEEIEESQRLESLETLELLLIDFLSESTKTNKEIYYFTLKNEYIPTHATQALKRLQGIGRIGVFEIGSNKKVRNGWFYISHKHFKNPNPKVLIKLLK